MADPVVQDETYDKLDLMLLNQNWNDNNERLVVSIGENAASYKWMHEQSSLFYNAVYKGLTIFITILSTATTTKVTVTMETDMIIKVLSYIVTVTTFILNFLNYEKLTIQHTTKSNEFSKLYHDIQLQMSKYRKNRNDANIYVSEVITKLDSLIVDGPQIPYIVIWRFKRLFNNSDISLPDIADRIQRIEIINELPKDIPKRDESLPSQPVALKRLTRINEIQSNFRINGDICDEELQMKKLIRNKAVMKYENERYSKHAERE